MRLARTRKSDDQPFSLRSDFAKEIRLKNYGRVFRDDGNCKVFIGIDAKDEWREKSAVGRRTWTIFFAVVVVVAKAERKNFFALKYFSALFCSRFFFSTRGRKFINMALKRRDRSEAVEAASF